MCISDSLILGNTEQLQLTKWYVGKVRAHQPCGFDLPWAPCCQDEHLALAQFNSTGEARVRCGAAAPPPARQLTLSTCKQCLTQRHWTSMPGIPCFAEKAKPYTLHAGSWDTLQQKECKAEVVSVCAEYRWAWHVLIPSRKTSYTGRKPAEGIWLWESTGTSFLQILPFWTKLC